MYLPPLPLPGEHPLSSIAISLVRLLPLLLDLLLFVLQNPSQKPLKIVLSEPQSVPSGQKQETEDVALDCVRVMYKVQDVGMRVNCLSLMKENGANRRRGLLEKCRNYNLGVNSLLMFF